MQKKRFRKNLNSIMKDLEGGKQNCSEQRAVYVCPVASAYLEEEKWF